MHFRIYTAENAEHAEKSPPAKYFPKTLQEKPINR